MSRSWGMSLPLPPGPCSCPTVGKWEQNQNHTQKHKAKMGTCCSRPALGRGGWGRVTEQSQLPEQGQEGSSRCSPVQREHHRVLPALERTGYLENWATIFPWAQGRQGERWVTVPCWQVFLLIKGEGKKEKKAPKKRNGRKLFWQRNRRFGYVTETASATVSLLQVYELIHQQQRPGYVGKTGLRASTVVSRMPTWKCER